MARTYREWRDDDPARGLDDPLFLEALGDRQQTGECTPPMDVLETAASIEVLLDLPGVPAADVRLRFVQGMLVISGQKLPEGCSGHAAAFHLAERTFGRFTRAVRVNGAVDAGRASATLVGGELRITVPRIGERRGREISIAITEP